MWASTVQDDFLALESLRNTVQKEEPPRWLTCSGEAAAYPRNTTDDWSEIEELTERHVESSRLAISHTVRSIHGAIVYLLGGISVSPSNASSHHKGVMNASALRTSARTGSVSTSPPPGSATAAVTCPCRFRLIPLIAFNFLQCSILLQRGQTGIEVGYDIFPAWIAFGKPYIKWKLVDSRGQPDDL